MSITKVSRNLLNTGVSDSSDATAITIDSSERIGIGITSPTTALEVIGDIKIKEGSAYSNYGLIDVSEAVLTLETYSVNTSSYPANIIFKPAGTERMRIDSSGNVGIGTTSPARSPLHLATSGTDYCQIHMTNGTSGSTSGDGLTLFTNSTDAGLMQRENSYLLFGTNDTERMRINSFGDILCGMTSASYLAAQDGIQIKKAGNIRIGGNGTAARNVMAFVNATDGTPAQVGYIQTSGSGTAFGTTSDYRLKQNVSYEFDALTRVKQLKPARFNFIVDADKTVDGFLAHEVSDIVPEAISGTKDAVDDEGNPEYQGIDQSKLVPLLTKAIQEQQEIIDDLKARIEVLEA